MTPTPTLDDHRTDQIRSFLVTEAAASTAPRQPARPVLTPARRRIVIGATAVLLLGGAFVTAEAVGGPAPAAIAVEIDGEWTTIRITDIDADPDAVVQDLIDAGFDARRDTLEVITTDDGRTVSPDSESTGTAANVLAFGHSDEQTGAHGIVGLSVSLPDGATPAPASGPAEEGTAVDTDPAEAQTGGGHLVAEDDLADRGVRFEDGGGVSLRTGTEATIVVYAQR